MQERFKFIFCHVMHGQQQLYRDGASMLPSCQTLTFLLPRCYRYQSTADTSVQEQAAVENVSLVVRYYKPSATKTATCKSWGPDNLGPHILKSWRGRVPRVPQGGCAYGQTTYYGNSRTLQYNCNVWFKNRLWNRPNSMQLTYRSQQGRIQLVHGRPMAQLKSWA